MCWLNIVFIATVQLIESDFSPYPNAAIAFVFLILFALKAKEEQIIG
jgi:hypothetical protein